MKSKPNTTKGNKNSKNYSSSSQIENTIKSIKTRSELRRSAMLRVGAYDLHQSLITSHFKIVEEIEFLSIRNKELSLRLKEMVFAFKQKERETSFSGQQV